jgi:nucleotide-binding universal stress UspA family protein
MINLVSGVGRLVVGTGGSPGSLPALRYARDLARANNVPLLAAIAWIPPGGDLAERRCPSPALRRAWADAAGDRLKAALDAAWGGVPPEEDIQLVVIRGEPGPALVHLADSGDDLLVVGAGRAGRLTRIWHGRVSRYCLSHARCPVVAVPQPVIARQVGLSPARWALRHRELTLDQAMREWDAAESAKGRSA